VTDTDFSVLDLKPPLLTNLSSLGYQQMTPIQQLSLPPILAGQDVIGQGKTGSGKTAAFGLGILQKLDVSDFQMPQALVLCPTRELADQVAKELRRLARTLPNIKILTLCGGVPFAPQSHSLDKGGHIVVGTPGRIDDHLRRKTLTLSALTTLVLDEADRMLDMGFQDSIDRIIQPLPKKRQTLLFSATYPQSIEAIARRVMKNPQRVEAPSVHDSATIKQYFYRVPPDNRLTALRLLLAEYKAISALIFCNTKRDTVEVAEDLKKGGFSALALHGDLDQKERDQALIRFSNQSVAVLVATDVAARGLDIESLDMVINYQVAHDPEVHVHRIGRTGRAGGRGVACTLYGDRDMAKIMALKLGINPERDADPLPPMSLLEKSPKKPLMATLRIDGGKKQKLRPGDIVGALTGEGGIAGYQVGKIHVSSNWSYVAVNRQVTKAALDKLGRGKLKGRSFRVRLIA
jgi:ATP-dependent RNA helicase DbpA